jgi:hypothetical protein
LPKDVVPHFVDGVVAGKTFAEMRMQPHFVPAAFTSPKANWV